MSGQEFLGSIRKDFARLVSERRSFVDPVVLLGDELASLLQVGPPGRPLTVLRDADRTRLRHFELSTRLRALERVSILVDEESARQLARRNVDEAIVFLRGNENWVDGLDVAFRMLRLGIRMGDRKGTNDLMTYMDGLWFDLERLRTATGQLFHRDREIHQPGAAIWLRNYLHERRIEAICSVVRPVSNANGLPVRLRRGIVSGRRTVGWRALVRRARLLAAADLRAFDREDDAFGENPYEAAGLRNGFGEEDQTLETRLGHIDQFVELCEQRGERAWANGAVRLFLCTRPPSYFDIAQRVLDRIEEGVQGDVFSVVLRLVNAVRGTEYREPVGSVEDLYTVSIPPSAMSTQTWGDPQIILGNLVSPEEYYSGAASRRQGSALGNPIVTRDRLRRVGRVLAEATRKARAYADGPSLLVLPELSVPRRWLREIATYVSGHGGFGLIAGLEYLHDVTERYVRNQAYAIIPGPYRSAAAWPWTKGFPAREEAQELAARHLTFPPTQVGRRRIIIVGPYGRVSVLICSELLEARRVADLVGRVEIVAVPSWNRDTASYEHLIQSAGLHLNGIVAVANNGHYSDCRAWAPRAERWERDLCRLIERDSDGVIAVVIPLRSLRDWRRQGGAGGGRTGGKAEWKPLPPDWQ